ncbi:bifunctional oligoribonuclease/PAP phosphatase NrnA [Cloacibacillus sp. An23]|uniref:DHH family phosphoesterase n=1 Tax=Cloacibacillus sp. An23 TaxID=1965591 RepID=UPI000B3A0B78|nr:bifunctional oligoribonuclease/PAP phosphatase NrnA [Cloacibacillus sp. An23]OUO93066.1 hypothetical protein B5F39_09475 [Cloacibacillus sp. An23]
MKNDDAFSEALAKLTKYGAWTLVCHERPDGDTLGSAFALYSLAKRSGRRAAIVSKDPLPQVFSFFPYSDELVRAENAPLPLAEGALLVAVDMSTAERSVDNFGELLGVCADSLCIDHHGDNKLFCKTNLVEPSASATAEIVVRLMEACGKGITPEEAAALYTALVTDNGNFRFSSTTAESHRCAGVLIEAGAKPAEIDDAVSQNMSLASTRLWGLALGRTELFGGGECALLRLSRAELDESGAGSAELDGLVNMPLRIKGVRLSLLVTEHDGFCKLSVRARPPYSARALAASFGGGGHPCAAGAKTASPLEEALDNVRKEALKCRSQESSL